MSEKRVVKVTELEKEICAKKYLERLGIEWLKVRVNEARGLDEEWEIFREALQAEREKCVASGRWEMGK